MKRNEEWGLYSLLIKQNSFLRRAVVILLLISFLLIGFAYEVLILRKDKIVLLDFHGQPQIVSYIDDSVFRSEVEFFGRMVINKIFGVNYGTLVNSQEWGKYIEDLRPFFARGFLEKFIHSLKETGFYETVVRGKLIVQPSTVAIRDLKTEGTKAVMYVTVGLSGISREGGSNYEERFYEIRVEKRDRTLANPWGLYLYYVVELSKEGVQLPVSGG
ncbi:MAG: hypothetical protein QXO76_00320 [Thermoproteota archaeon]